MTVSEKCQWCYFCFTSYPLQNSKIKIYAVMELFWEPIQIYILSLLLSTICTTLSVTVQKKVTSRARIFAMREVCTRRIWVHFTLLGLIVKSPLFFLVTFRRANFQGVNLLAKFVKKKMKARILGGPMYYWTSCRQIYLFIYLFHNILPGWPTQHELIYSRAMYTIKSH